MCVCASPLLRSGYATRSWHATPSLRNLDYVRVVERHAARLVRRPDEHTIEREREVARAHAHRASGARRGRRVGREVLCAPCDEARPATRRHGVIGFEMVRSKPRNGSRVRATRARFGEAGTSAAARETTTARLFRAATSILTCCCAACWFVSHTHLHAPRGEQAVHRCAALVVLRARLVEHVVGALIDRRRRRAPVRLVVAPP